MKAEPAHATADSRRDRLLTCLVWCLIQAVITVVLRLEAAFTYGAKVPVYYPPGRPSRFVIDVPFAPTMADFFL
jgi:hypothetical protein